jgi:periplasmic divalent cation tolerance protein
MAGKGFLQVVTTVPNARVAKALADAVIGKKLAGCFQVIGPMKSIYRWRGKIEKTREYLCLIKTRKSLYGRLEREVKKLHPYTVPEILAVPVVAGNREYLKWLKESTEL